MRSRKTTMIKLGQRMTRTLRIYDPAQGCNLAATTVEAEVVYIHPERRFYVIEYKLPHGRRFRATEYFYPRCGTMTETD